MTTSASSFEEQVAAGDRFEFGRNWSRFLAVLDDERIRAAEVSLREMLQVDDLQGRTFIDIGSGSGLSSLVAMRLGASRVHSFDFDPHSVGCAQELRRRYYPGDARWTVERGSALDASYMESLGTWDIVYSWGVLHHTGQMWKGLELAAGRVAPDGTLFVAIYNDQGWVSRWWRRVKVFYNHSPFTRALTIGVYFPYLLPRWPEDRHREEAEPHGTLSRGTRKSAACRRCTTGYDWLGGLPFEVAKPEEIFDFYHQRGFDLARLRTCGGGLGCNELVMTRRVAP